jgi:hypothetical protein
MSRTLPGRARRFLARSALALCAVAPVAFAQSD